MRRYAMLWCAAKKAKEDTKMTEKSLKGNTMADVAASPGILGLPEDDDAAHRIMTEITTTLLSIDPQVSLARDHDDQTPLDYYATMESSFPSSLSVIHSITQNLIQAAKLAQSNRCSER